MVKPALPPRPAQMNKPLPRTPKPALPPRPAQMNKPLPRTPKPMVPTKPLHLRVNHYRPPIAPKPANMKTRSVVKPAITEASPASRGMQPKLTINTGSLPQSTQKASPTPTTPEMMALFGMKAQAPMSPASQLKAVQKAGEDLSFLYTKKTPGQKRGSMIMKKAKARSGGKNVPTKIKNFFGKFRKW